MKSLAQLISEIDLPKNQWTSIKGKDVDDSSENIYDLIANAYASIGGHPGFQSPDDVAGGDGKLYTVIDLDDDPDIDAVGVAKLRPGGIKHVATGHDGSKPAKRAIVNKNSADLNKPGNYIEVSGRIKDILLDAGVEQVTDEATLKKVLDGKEIEINKDGSYERYIGGKKYNKILLGKPL